MQWCSCCLLHLFVQLIERRLPARTSARTDVADQRLGFHDPHVRLFVNGEQVIGTIANGNAATSPVIGKSDLMYAAPFDEERAHARCDQHTCFDDSTWAHDGREGTVLKSDFSCHFGRDLAEKLRLQLSKMRECAAHPSCRVMLG